MLLTKGLVIANYLLVISLHKSKLGVKVGIKQLILSFVAFKLASFFFELVILFFKH